MEAALRTLVFERAGYVCEYCRMIQHLDPLPFCIDHIVAQQHHGPTVESNLALSCFSCNSYKGPNIAGIDHATGNIIRLFHPRVDTWDDHFEWSGALLVGKSAIAEATIDVLSINMSDRVEHRHLLLREGVFPP